MAAAEYRQTLKALGFSQEGFGDFVKVSKRTAQGYALGETPVPGPTAILLRLMVAGKVSIEDVEKARK